MNSPGFKHAVILLAAAFMMSACGAPPAKLGAKSVGGESATRKAAAQRPQKTPPPVAPGKSVATAQRMLRDLGYDPGPPDGVPGDRTNSAIRRYQARHKMTVDGRVTGDLISSLTNVLGKDALGTRLSGKIRPRYAPGDTYVYSDGRAETVVRVEDGLVLWRGQSGDRFESFENVVLPPVSWVSRMHHGLRRMDVSADVLWPLKKGNTAAFQVRIEMMAQGKPPERTELVENWTCRVDGRATVTVPAGTFDTYKIDCTAMEIGTNILVERTWYYAPIIRHHVRYLQSATESAPALRSDLAGIRFGGQDWPPAARSGLDWAVDDTLETKETGDSTVWRSSAVKARVRVIPTSDVKIRDGAYCRRFLTIVSRPNRKVIYPATACRNQSGTWSIPGLERQ